MADEANPKPLLIVICGATATGKTGLAIEIAERLNIPIINADSRTIYRDFDIGTAKPTLEERKGVPHYLIDAHDPGDTVTLARYQESARELIDTLPSPLLLVGGTGLYIKSVVRGLKIPRVAPRPELRRQLQSLGQAYLYNLLKSVDRPATEKIHPHDENRTLRALEVFYTTGQPISAQQGEEPPDYPILQIGLDRSPDILQKRIETRTGEMIERGLVGEVEGLIDKYGHDLPLLDTLGYAEIKSYLKGEISLQEAIDLTIIHTRQFAKRQRTWFRSVPDIHWFSCRENNLLEQVYQKINIFIDTHRLTYTCTN